MRLITLTAAALATTAFAGPAAARPTTYDLTLARQQIEVLLREAQRQRKLTAAQVQDMTRAIAGSDAKLREIADGLRAEGVDLGSPLAGTDAAALLASVEAKLSDGRGAVEAEITGRTAGVRPTVGNLTSVAAIGRPGPPALVDTTTRPRQPGRDSSMFSDEPAGGSGGTPPADDRSVFQKIWDWFTKPPKPAPVPGEGSGTGGPTNQPAPKPPCDEDVDVMCGFKGTTGGWAGGDKKGGAKPDRPDPTGEYRRPKPDQLDPGLVGGALGGRVGQQSTPAPEGTGGAETGTRTGPATAPNLGGGVGNPGTPVTQDQGIRAPRPKMDPLDPLIDPTPDGQKPKGTGPGQPGAPDPSNPGQG